jgi:hypothetical protein
MEGSYGNSHRGARAIHSCNDGLHKHVREDKCKRAKNLKQNTNDLQATVESNTDQETWQPHFYSFNTV